MFTKQDSATVQDNSSEQSSSLPNSGSFMMLLAHRRRSNSYPLARTASTEESTTGRDIPPAPASSSRFIFGLTPEEYDEIDAGAPIPVSEVRQLNEVIHQKLFFPRNKSSTRVLEIEAVTRTEECSSEVNNSLVKS